MNGLNPPTHHQVTEQLMVPDQLVGLIIGKQGEQINRIQQETGCRVQIVPHSIGTSDRPCTLVGSPQQVMMARSKLNEIIMRGGPRENQGYGNGDNNQMSYNEYQITVEMMIPPDKCGLIIGKGGNTLKTMMQEHSVKLHLVQDSAEVTKDEKPLKIIGTRQSVEEARRAVLFLMSQKDGNKVGGALSPLGKPTIEVTVPKAAVGVVIGRGGENISRIQTETGTRIQFKPDDPNLDHRGCVISGTQEACNSAQDKIKEIAAQKLAEQGQSGQVSQMGVFDTFGMGTQTVEFPVPANRAGVVIGKGGENIRLIKEKSGAFVQIEKHVGDVDKDPNWKTFIIRGTQMQIEEAQRLIQEKAGVAPPPQSNQTNPSMHQYGDGPATPLGTPGTPIAHAHTPINNLMNQMNSMNLGTPGTPQPPHPQSQQMMGPWSTPDHNQPTDSQMNQWYSMYHQPQNASYQQWNNQGRPHGQGHAGQGPAQGQPHGPDYSRQWEEYWKQMNPNQPHHSQSPYSAHGQVMGGPQAQTSQSNPQEAQQWRGHDGSGYAYMNQGQNHGYPANAYPAYPTQDHGLIYRNHVIESQSYTTPTQMLQTSHAQIAPPPGSFNANLENLHDDQDNSPIHTSRYSPQSQ